MTRTSIARMGTLLAFFMLFTVSAQAQEKQDAEVRDPDVVLHVKGMACPNCARNMDNAVSAVEGVEAAEVLLDKQKVVVTLKEGQEVSEEALKEAVTSAGYVFRKAVFPEKKDAGKSGSA